MDLLLKTHELCSWHGDNRQHTLHCFLLTLFDPIQAPKRIIIITHLFSPANPQFGHGSSGSTRVTLQEDSRVKPALLDTKKQQRGLPRLFLRLSPVALCREVILGFYSELRTTGKTLRHKVKVLVFDQHSIKPACQQS